ncbi:hypothetical protein ACFU8T_07685 [Sphingobacterium spiritivorum]|uniref:Lipocalin-like domain-containing protein n=1 Tax=Sphingobacterium spiritivorum ATCC 33861 TaxID=525373 RepID=D7VTE7_SPHSI|nr:hypothetical protein [Sphingobacterium spiritivorum]EFK57048.1 hypothetical protein HMPREF0766_14251 [Sphingobacterium spiritivorum ATCC 33861]QQT34949.1 hypothetical protein I6J01_16860 [Sphingobacterium spiritivorum]WQD35844.1 hypothetical protein U0038_08805 [Sphingobacterium spiritivorum]
MKGLQQQKSQLLIYDYMVRKSNTVNGTVFVNSYVKTEMTFTPYFLLLFNLSFIPHSNNHIQQKQDIQKKWKIVSEEITYLNPDHSKNEGLRGRTDYSRSEKDTIHFLPDGKFNSVDGNGSYTLSGDSIHMNIGDQKSSFAYQISDSTLIMRQDYKTPSYLKRVTLNLKVLEK